MPCLSARLTQIIANDRGSPALTQKIRGQILFVAFVAFVSGVGLAITHQIIRAHNGRIRVKDTKEKRTAFEIRLPIKMSPV